MSFLEKLGQKFANAIASRIHAPDPASFGDPVALRTSWSPLKKGGSSFRTQKLVERAPGQLAFRPTVRLYLFGALFAGVGLAFAVPSLLHLSPCALFGLLFVGAGVFMAWPRTLLFDGNARACTLGATQTPYEQIHAIQLIKEWVSGEDDSYYSYELNLVLKDGSRLQVVDHANIDALRVEAAQLAQHLGCKVWDGELAPQLTGEQAIAILQQH